MKKSVAVILGLLIVGVPAFAAENAKAPKTSPQAKQKDDEDRRKKLDEKINAINGKDWKVVLTPDHPKLKPVEDILSFQGHTVQMSYFDKKGFQPTNYTVTLDDDEGEAVNWETMKTHPEGGGRVVFLRGLWVGGRMSGVATEKNPGSKDKDMESIRYTFVGSSSKDAPDPKAASGEKISGTTDAPKILKSEEAPTSAKK